MASIKVLELRPVEDQVKELSDNIISKIWGGVDDLSESEFVYCYGLAIQSLLQGGTLADAAAIFEECLTLEAFDGNAVPGVVA